MRFVSAVLALLFLTACASTGSGNEIFRLADPRGDDYGDGSIDYPMSGDMHKGDLDLLELSAYSATGGTRFVATFARPIDIPGEQTVDTIGTSLNTLARFGFYTFNIDIYIDTDRQPGSGSTSTLPGRKVQIDPATAWEKAIILTPDPTLARSELRRLLLNQERKEMKEAGEKADAASIEAKKQALRASVENFTFFPEQIIVTGSRIEFFVPAAILGGGAARADWAYTVIVSGADLIERMDQQGRLVGTESYDTVYILPVNIGRPLYSWSTTREDFVQQPPLIDIIVPAGMDQKKVLDFSPAQPAVLTGVVPGT